MSRAPASVPSRSFPCAWVIIWQFVKHEIWQRVGVVLQEASRLFCTRHEAHLLLGLELQFFKVLGSEM